MCTFFLVVAFRDARFLSGLYGRFSYIVYECPLGPCTIIKILRKEKSVGLGTALSQSGSWRTFWLKDPMHQVHVLFESETTPCLSVCALRAVVLLPLGASAVGSFAPWPTYPTPTNFTTCACGNPWGTKMDHACAQLDEQGCRTLLQYARMHASL